MQDGKITWIVGVTGSGKSHATAQALRSPKLNRLLLLDFKGEYADPRSPMSVEGRTWPNWRTFLEAADDDEFELGREIIHARAFDRDTFASVLRWSYRVGNHLLVVDEWAHYCDVDDFPEAEVRDIAFSSRSRGLDVVFMTQRPVGIPTNLVSQASDIVLYQVRRRADRRFLQGELDFDDATFERLKSLSRGEHLVFRLGFDGKPVASRVGAKE